MHTLTPWDKGDRYNRGDGIIFGFNCIPVLIYDRLTKDEDIDYILHCVNNHNKLVEALQNIATRSEGNDSFVAADVNALAKLALSQANTQQQEKIK